MSQWLSAGLVTAAHRILNQLMERLHPFAVRGIGDSYSTTIDRNDFLFTYIVLFFHSVFSSSRLMPRLTLIAISIWFISSSLA